MRDNTICYSAVNPLSPVLGELMIGKDFTLKVGQN